MAAVQEESGEMDRQSVVESIECGGVSQSSVCMDASSFRAH